MVSVTSSLSISTNEFAEALLGMGLTKGFVVHNHDGNPIVSNPKLRDFAQALSLLPAYSSHEAIFFQVNEPTQCLFFVFVHNTVRGSAQGGTRMLPYNTVNELLSDGLRLSKAMTDKNSVAGLWWGGGKSIICPLAPKEIPAGEQRAEIFKNFGRFVASLNGLYVAAEDMNTTPEDMLTILSANRFVTCLPANVGGSSNPSPWTALGVFKAMQATIHSYEGTDSLRGKTVAIQGVGNVGRALAELLLADGAALIVYDVNPEAVRNLTRLSPKVTAVSQPAEIYSADCDIFSPCARGGALNAETIPAIRARFVIGAANNQLQSDEMAALLHQQGIIYIPDFFVNRMGIVNCANEQYGRLETDLLDAVNFLYQDVLNLLEDAETNRISPQEAALKIARQRSKIEHPIWGHRGSQLIDYLVREWK